MNNIFITYIICWGVTAGVMLNLFPGWPIGPAKISFGWPAVSFSGPRYLHSHYRIQRALYNYHILIKQQTVRLFLMTYIHGGRPLDQDSINARLRLLLLAYRVCAFLRLFKI